VGPHMGDNLLFVLAEKDEVDDLFRVVKVRVLQNQGGKK